jgi:hypothetical protein
MRPKILAAGIASERELDEVDHAVREHLSDPGTLMMPHLLVLAWGRKPDGRILLAGAPREVMKDDARDPDRVPRPRGLAALAGGRCEGPLLAMRAGSGRYLSRASELDRRLDHQTAYSLIHRS